MSQASYTSPLAQALASDLLERFLRYVRIDTQSRRGRERSPSTPGQLELGRLLVAELRDAGLPDADLDENGYVMATLAASAAGNGGLASRAQSEWPVIVIVTSNAEKVSSCNSPRVEPSIV